MKYKRYVCVFAAQILEYVNDLMLKKYRNNNYYKNGYL
jgi:hypothetical protein